MVEGSFRSYDPLAYHVNNVGDLNVEAVKAHRANNQDEIQQLLQRGDKSDCDVFICVNKGWHAFVLCCPVNSSSGHLLDPFADMPTGDPFAVPAQLLVWEIELCFEAESQRMYKIRFKLQLFGEIKKQIKKSFFIGRYKGVPINGLQFAILRASPKRYKVLLEDCVEFAKTFCYELLSYSDNGRDIEQDVESRLQEASGSGLSVETLSRRVRSSALLGNSLLGALDMSTFSVGKSGICMIILAIIVLTIYMAVVCAFVCYVMVNVLAHK